MLAARISDHRSSDPAIITSEKIVAWTELNRHIDRLAEQFVSLASRKVGICLPVSAEGVAALAALDRVGSHAYLISQAATDDQIESFVRRFDLETVIRFTGDNWQVADQTPKSGGESNVIDAALTSTVTILTSGTEGTPKAATYEWARLAKPVRIISAADRTANVWLLTFRIHLYAGLQVLLQSLLNGQTLVMPDPAAQPTDVTRLMAEANVTSASATPAYWRRLLLFGNQQQLAKTPLRQITLGGELADQAILDSLAAQWPEARLTHIYASTELGRCFAVTDGRAGFPLEYLSQDHQSPQLDAQLKVADGQLFAKPVNGSATIESVSGESAQSDGWMATGDLVEVTADRVYFAGRQGDMINVGGNKVRPAIVEAVIRSVAGIADVRVFAHNSSIAGQLVACELVPLPGEEPSEIKLRVQLACRESLEPFQLPRIIQFVDKIEISEAGKTKRRPEAG